MIYQPEQVESVAGLTSNCFIPLWEGCLTLFSCNEPLGVFCSLVLFSGVP